ncbi:MAG TPA: hypothetical protein DCY61_01475, partial [Dehalococcoidia bacterium]|nr:hypothetical protein [Dehalococcoidia bacterium]
SPCLPRCIIFHDAILTKRYSGNVSLGNNSVHVVGEAVEESVNALKEQQQGRLNIDETGWKKGWQPQHASLLPLSGCVELWDYLAHALVHYRSGQPVPLLDLSSG